MKYYPYYFGEVTSCFGVTISGLNCFDGIIHQNSEQIVYGILTGFVCYGLDLAFSAERKKLEGLEKKIDP